MCCSSLIDGKIGDIFLKMLRSSLIGQDNGKLFSNWLKMIGAKVGCYSLIDWKITAISPLAKNCTAFLGLAENYTAVLWLV